MFGMLRKHGTQHPTTWPLGPSIAWVLGSCAAWLGLALLTAAHAGPQHQVKLADGQTLQGIIIPATECAWILQTEDLCLELSASQIASVDGKPGVEVLLQDEVPALLRTETYDEVTRDGAVVQHSRFARANRSMTTVDEIQWGLAPHEMALLPHWQAFDEFGNELPIRIEKTDAGSARAHARLVRPIVPGETLRFTSRIRHGDRIRREGDVLRYVHRGDYPEDRLVTKMVCLPAGAQVVSVSPEPVQRFEHDGKPYILWRRYYVAGEAHPLEVRYRLGMRE